MQKIKDNASSYLSQFKGRSLLTLDDWEASDIEKILDLSSILKEQSHSSLTFSRMQGKTCALIFEKRSTRTRSAFETAIGEEGGHPVFMAIDDIQLGEKESIKDTARVLGRMYNAIEFRGYKQAYAEELSLYSKVPVINGLTDTQHPTQMLADLMTIKEVFGKVEGLKLSYLGDGRNNTALSLLGVLGKMGTSFSLISPTSLQPSSTLIAKYLPLYKENNATLTITNEVEEVKSSNIIYTDVWVSMGEAVDKEERKSLLFPYQVNSNLMNLADKDAIFLHCLPAIKEEEVTEAVFESTQSRVFQQAENRKHTIKAVLLSVL